MENVLYGTCSENCAGYCKRHGCYMTVKQIRGKDCLGKNCWHLERNLEHEWWSQRERARMKRKNRKIEIEKKLKGA